MAERDRLYIRLGKIGKGEKFGNTGGKKKHSAK